MPTGRRFGALTPLFALACSCGGEGHSQPAAGDASIFPQGAPSAVASEASARGAVDRLRASGLAGAVLEARPLVLRDGAYRAVDTSPRSLLLAALPDHSAGEIRLTPAGGVDAWIAIRAQDVRDVPASEDRNALAFVGALDGVDLIHTLGRDRFEELRLVRAPAAHHVARYRLRAGPEIRSLRVRERYVEAVDAKGYVRVSGAPPFAVDALGERRELTPELARAGDEWVLTIDARLDGLTPPIAIDPSWSTVASMATGRAWASVAAMPGGKVLVVGGYTGKTGASTLLSTAEIYDSATNTWSATASAPATMSRGFGLALPSGKVVFGASVYTPSSGTWLTATGTAPGGPVLLVAGKAFQFGPGNGMPTTLDEATNTWKSGTKIPTPGTQQGVSLLTDGRLLVAGGVVAATGEYLQTAQLYSPGTDTWTPVSPMRGRRVSPAVIPLSGGRALVVNGSPRGTPWTSEVFDPATNSFQPGPAPLTYGSLLVATDARPLVLYDQGSHAVFDVAANAFLKVSDPTAVDLSSAARAPLPGGRALFAGDADPAGNYVGTTTLFTPMPAGSTCTATLPGECASGNCVDGVCCDRACDGVCERCDVVGSIGTCKAIASGPPRAASSCAPYAACTAGSCSTSCSTNTDCAAVGTTPSYCAAGLCKPAGAKGAPCAVDGECQSSHCVDGVCCASACTGQCEACGVAGSEGTCIAVAGAVRGTRTPCPGASSQCGQRCDGKTRTTCLYAAAGLTPCGTNACTAGYETIASTCDGKGACTAGPKSCGAYACGAVACKSACGSRADCSAGYVCTSGACTMAPGLGTKCTSGDACSTGFCVDGVCCASSACGAGSSCATPEKPGHCAKATGAGCGVDDECASGHCADGVCCGNACAGQCEACDVPGQIGSCTPVLGAPRGARTACPSDPTNACAGKLCDGVDRASCAKLAGKETACRAPSCKDGSASAEALCDGTGTCAALVTTSCGGFACDAQGRACREVCATDAECAPEFGCVAGKCRPKAGACTDDGLSVLGPDGAPLSCGAYRCKGGACVGKCATTDDCVPGLSCGGDGTCMAPSAGGESSGCSTSGGRGGRGSLGALALLALGAVVARSRRRGGRAASLAGSCAIAAIAAIGVGASGGGLGCTSGEPGRGAEIDAGAPSGASVEVASNDVGAANLAQTRARAVLAELSSVPALADRTGVGTKLVRRSERIEVDGAPGIRSFVPVGAQHLRVSLPRHANAGVHLGLDDDPGFTLDVRALGDDAAGDGGAPGTIAGGAVVHARVRMATDLVHVVDARGFEELRLLRSTKAPTSTRYAITRGPSVAALRLRGGRIEALDAQGSVRVTSLSAYAVDAAGTTRDAIVELHDDGREAVATVSIDTRDLRFPVVVDPAWTSTSDAAFALDDHYRSQSRQHLFNVAGGGVYRAGQPFVGNQWWAHERYAPATDTWTALAWPIYGSPSYSSRSLTDGAMVQLPSGLIFAAGGQDWGSLYGSTTSTVQFDGSLATPVYTAGPSLLVPRQAHAYAWIGGSVSRLLVAGGQTTTLTGTTTRLASAELVDPVGKTVVAAGSLAQTRYSGVAVAVGTTVYVFGGHTPASGSAAQERSVEAFDGVTKTWSTKASMPTGLGGARPLALPSGKILLGYGSTASTGGQTSALLFDPATNAWTNTGPSLKRTVPALVSLPSGKVLAFSDVSTAELYDPATNTWAPAGTMLSARRGPTGIAMPDGRVLIAGGGDPATTTGYSPFAEIFQQLPKGSACTGPGECTTGACIDGVCCDRACNGACESCNQVGSVGTCRALSGAPLAGHASCAPYAACVSGACKTSCSTDADCCAQGACTAGYGGAYCAAGTCVARKANGQPATVGVQCISGFAADGLCCDAPCTGQCESCDVTPGTCKAVTGAPKGSRAPCDATDPAGTCAPRCDGVTRSICTFVSAATACGTTACASGVETHTRQCDGFGHCGDSPKACGAYACGATACKTTCVANADCSAGFVCNLSACVPAPGLGQPCSSSAACSGGLSCTDGVCCGSANCGLSRSCALPATAGTCASVAGTTCSSDGECGSGACVDGVCCESSCSGQCQACNEPGSLGKCVPVKGAPRGKRPACAASPGNPCEASSCNGSDGSRCAAYAGPEVSCRASSCIDAVAIEAASCNGLGVCPDAAKRACAPYGCEATSAACRTTCATLDDCAPGFLCIAAACVKPTTACSEDGRSVVDGQGVASTCAPLVCREGACLEQCAESADCVPPSLCGAGGRCVAPEATPSADTAGCQASPARATSGLTRVALAALGGLGALAALVRGRRRRR